MHTASRAKSDTGNVIFVLKHFLIEFFYIFSIFPEGPCTYFYDIFDQKNFDQNLRRLLILNLGGLTQKWGLLLGPNSPTLKSRRKSFKKSCFCVFFCSHAAPSRCWESYLSCSKRSENIINRKIGNFYIEIISTFFSQLQFFSSSKI